MGLIKAGIGALGGALADQWKEFFYCDSIDKDLLREGLASNSDTSTDSLFSSAIGTFKKSGRRESNPRLELGKLPFYH